MFWAIAGSAFVIYLIYRKLNAESVPAAASGEAPGGTIKAEIAALNAQITAIENKIAGSGSGGVGP
jgi:hypothetical protein